eukprot:345604-Rhodomonas_salina.1
MRMSCSQLTGFGSDHQFADFSAGMSTGGSKQPYTAKTMLKWRGMMSGTVRADQCLATAHSRNFSGTNFEPICAGIHFWAMAESHQSKQYLYDFKLDSNDSKVNKVQNALLQLVKLLPPGSKNYQIAADNLFNSVDTCRKVAAAGHRIY